MPPAFVQGGSVSAGGATSATFTFTSNVTPGSAILVADFEVTTTLSGVADNVGSQGGGPTTAYRSAGTPVSGAIGGPYYLYYTWNAGGGPTQVTLTYAGGSSFPSSIVAEVSGIHTTSDPLDGYAANFSNSASVLAVAGTVSAVSGDYVALFVVTQNGGANGTDHGFTTRVDPSFGFYTMKDLIAAGSTVAQSTISSGDWVAAALALQPAGSAAASDLIPMIGGGRRPVDHPYLRMQPREEECRALRRVSRNARRKESGLWL